VSAGISVGAAEAGGVGQGFGSEGGDAGAGEESELQGASSDPGDGPLGGFGAAEGVLAEKALVGGDVEAVEVAGPGGGGGFCGEEGGGFFGVEFADLGDGVGGEVDGELAGGKVDIAGDAAGGGAEGAPLASLLGVQGEGAEGEHDCGEGAGEDHGLEDGIGGGEWQGVQVDLAVRGAVEVAVEGRGIEIQRTRVVEDEGLRF
jgi:hypothetical protein